MRSNVSSLLPAALGDGLLGSKRGKVALLLAVVVLTAGCTGTGGDETAATDPIDAVPADVDAVAQIDVDAGNGTASLASELNATDFDALTDGEGSGHDGLLSDLLGANTTHSGANGSAVDAEAIDSVTAFARLPDTRQADGAATGDAYLGAIVDSSLSWEAIADASGGALDNVSERTESGVTVYVLDHRGTESWIADFEDGTFAVGTEAAVTDVIETRNGEAEAFSGDLRDAYENADDGQLKLALELPADAFGGQGNDSTVGGPGEQTEGLPSNLDLPTVQVLTLVTDTDGTNVSVAAQLTTESASGASELAGLFELASSFDDGTSERAALSLLSEIEVDQQGRHLTLRSTLSATELADLAEQFAQFTPEEMGVPREGSNSASTSAGGQPALAGE